MKVYTESNIGPKQIIPAGLFDIDTASFPTTTSVLVPIAQMKSFECLGYRASNIQHGGGVARKDCPEPTDTLRRVFQLMHQSIDGLARVHAIPIDHWIEVLQGHIKPLFPMWGNLNKRGQG